MREADEGRKEKEEKEASSAEPSANLRRLIPLLLLSTLPAFASSNDEQPANVLHYNIRHSIMLVTVAIIDVIKADFTGASQLKVADGVLGQDVLSNFASIRINYRQQTIELFDR